jgi:hypothetical protein
MINTIDALQTLRPKAQWVLRGDSLEWLDTVQTEPTSTELATEVLRLQSVYDSQAYARSRKAAYDLLNQFEMQFDDAANGTTTWIDAINAIKQEFPK